MYTGHHKHRFDRSGQGLGLDGRESIAKGEVLGKANGPRMTHVGRIESPNMNPEPIELKQSPDGRNYELETPIFRKLTDPKEYTGHHKHRFDKKTGRGKGLRGRDSVRKGTGTGVHTEASWTSITSNEESAAPPVCAYSCR